MKKTYEGYEDIYRRMRQKGFTAWGHKGSGSAGPACDKQMVGFLEDVFSQPWMPESGRVLELGCGTGPILRWVCTRGFSGVGVDISETAIEMAKEQTEAGDIEFVTADVCGNGLSGLGEFDVVIDGLCLHCIVDMENRKSWLENAMSLLKDGGVFILMSMCGPVDRERLVSQWEGQRIVGDVIYVPVEDESYGGLVKFGGQSYLPSRYVGHWSNILTEMRKAGFAVKFVRYNGYNSEDVCGTLQAAGVKE